MSSDLVIRTFEERDRLALRNLFRRAGDGSPSAALWGDEASETAVYLDPYMDLEPQSLLLAFSDGEMTGYLAGCLDSTRLPSESERVARAITEHRLYRRPSAIRFFALALTDTVIARVRGEETAGDFVDARWPAHLHIAVAPEARGSGVASGLMHQWFSRLAATGTPGCYLQTLAENSRAVRFFARMGFLNHGPALLVPGLRSQSQRQHQQTMVWNP